MDPWDAALSKDNFANFPKRVELRIFNTTTQGRIPTKMDESVNIYKDKWSYNPYKILQVEL